MYETGVKHQSVEGLTPTHDMTCIQKLANLLGSACGFKSISDAKYMILEN